MKRRRRRSETWEQAQQRILAETSLFLSHHLQHPEESVSIPVIPSGRGEFPRSLTAAFWAKILFQ